MNLDEKYSDLLAIIWPRMKIVLVNESITTNYLRQIFYIVQWIENDPEARSIVHYKNISILVEQLMILAYAERLVVYDIHRLRHVLRDAMYLLQSSMLADNLRSKKGGCCLPW